MEEFVVKSGSGTVFGKIAYPEEEGPRPAVIFSHGFGASHVYDSGMEAPFVQRGFVFVAFDFRGGGAESLSSGTMREMSVLTEAVDLMAVLDYVKALDIVDANRVFLMGSSQGGYVSAYVAAKRSDEVRGLALFFPAFNIADDTRLRMKLRGGTMPAIVEIGPHTVGRRYEEDAISVDIFDEIARYSGDVFILHGAKDEIVPLEYSRRAASIYGDACELVVLDELGHGFRSSPRELHEQALDRAIDFMKERA